MTTIAAAAFLGVALVAGSETRALNGHAVLAANAGLVVLSASLTLAVQRRAARA